MSAVLLNMAVKGQARPVPDRYQHDEILLKTNKAFHFEPSYFILIIDISLDQY